MGYEQAVSIDNDIERQYKEEKGYNKKVNWAYTDKDRQELKSRIKWRKLEAQASITGDIAYKKGAKDERERLIKEGLYTEKQYLFKFYNRMKSDFEGLHAEVLKMAYDEGMKKVVEWVENNSYIIALGWFAFKDKDWQEFKKEKGIK